MALKPHPKPNGPETEFIVMPNSQYKHGERIPVGINGHDYYVTVGERSKAPKEVLLQLQNAKSVATPVPDLDRAERSPRSQDKFYNPQTTWHYENNFHIEVLKEASER